MDPFFCQITLCVNCSCASRMDYAHLMSVAHGDRAELARAVVPTGSPHFGLDVEVEAVALI